MPRSNKAHRPTTAISVLLPNVSTKALSYLIYGAKEFSARQALNCGLVTDVFPHADFTRETSSFVRDTGRPAASHTGEYQAISRQGGRPVARHARPNYAIAVRALAATEGYERQNIRARPKRAGARSNGGYVRCLDVSSR